MLSPFTPSASSKTSPVLLGGKAVPGEGEPINSIDPSDGKLFHTVATASKDQVETATQLASEAMCQGPWADMKMHQRGQVLASIAGVIRKNADHLAKLQTVQNGKPITESRNQAEAAAAVFQYYAAVCETLSDEASPSRGDYFNITVHEPVGVVAAITPWNSPLTMAAQKLAPALAAGNGIILKPAEFTSVVSLELGHLCMEADLPPGLLSVLPGGAEIGRQLVSDRNIGLVSFTGGTETGRSIAEIAANRLVPTILELGGKSPNIVFADADLDKAARAVANGIFESNGQSCVAGSRLFVEHAVADRFMDLLLAATRRMEIGHPQSQRTNIGPLVSREHLARIERYVQIAREEGGEILIGGARPDDAELSDGNYFLPTVIGGLDNNATVVREEIFGPVLCCMSFSDEDDLVHQANDSIFGLACGIWTADYPKAWKIARSIQAGTVWINTYKALSIANPFGGFKQSGIGREKGIEGLRSYQLSKSILFGT